MSALETSSDQTTPTPQTSKPRWVRAGVWCAVILLVGAAAFILSPPRNNYPVWQINDQVRVTLHQILTDPSQQIKVMPWYHEWLSKTPKKIKDLLGNPKFLDYSGMSRAGHYLDSVTLVLRIDHPESWIDTSRGSWVHPYDNDLRELLQKHKAVVFGNPEYRPIRFEQVYYPTLLGGKRFPTAFVLVPFANSTIPRNAPELTVEFYENDSVLSVTEVPDRATPKHTFTIPNPLFTNERPIILKPDTLPASVTHSGVTVTINQAVSKFSQKRQRGGRQDANPRDRAAGTLNDPFTSKVDLTVTEDGKETPDWKVKDLQPFYTTEKDSYPFARDSQWTTLTQDGHLKTSRLLSNDIGVLKQPVKMHVTLVRQNNFPPDECVTIELPIPAQGTTEMLTSATARFWNGDAQFQEIAHNAPISSRRVHFSDSYTSETHVIQIQGTGHASFSFSGMVTSATLLSETAPPADFLKLFDPSGTSSMNDGRKQDWVSSYRLAGHRYHSRKRDSAPINMADYTTLSVTLTQLRDFPHTFEFVVEPTDAPE